MTKTVVAVLLTALCAALANMLVDMPPGSLPDQMRIAHVLLLAGPGYGAQWLLVSAVAAAVWLIACRAWRPSPGPRWTVGFIASTALLYGVLHLVMPVHAAAGDGPVQAMSLGGYVVFEQGRANVGNLIRWVAFEGWQQMVIAALTGWAISRLRPITGR